MTVNFTDATPGGGIALLHGLSQPHFVGVLTANALGNASLSFNAPVRLCGRTILGVDIGSCIASNSIVL